MDMQKKRGLGVWPGVQKMQQEVRAPGVQPLPQEMSKLDVVTPASSGVQATAEKPIGVEQVRKAAEVLARYRQGKANLVARLIDNEKWWKLQGGAGDTEKPDSAWMFNSLANKHADAMDNFPEPTILPRARDDEETAKLLSKVLPVALAQSGYATTYSDVWWYKLKMGTGVKGVFWNSSKNGIGDIDVRKVDLLNLYWEPGITDVQKSRNLFHVELVDNEVIRQRWPFVEALGGQTPEVSHYVYDDQVDTSEKSAVVDWYYKKTVGTVQVLHYCKFVNGTVLFASENEPEYARRGYYDHGKYPFVFDTLFPVEGSPCGFGYVDIMKGCQREIDLLGDSVMRNAKVCSTARFFVRGDSSINETEFADLSKDLVHTDGNLGDDSLRQIVYSPLGSIYVTMLNNKIEELKETSGNRDFSQGATSSGVTAASAIAALQEAGSKLSRDMIQGAYRAFEEECYLCIELMRQFYDEPRCFRITGGTTGFDYANFSNAGLRPVEQGVAFGIDLGSREPIFDIQVVASKKSSISRLSQNELAKEFYQLGFFNPQLADQSLACLDMMDFDGKEKIVERVQQNGTLLQQVQMLTQQVSKLAAIVDAQNGTSILQGVAAQGGADAGSVMPNATDNQTRSTDSLGGVLMGDALATQARRRAQEGATPK